MLCWASLEGSPLNLAPSRTDSLISEQVRLQKRGFRPQLI